MEPDENNPAENADDAQDDADAEPEPVHNAELVEPQDNPEEEDDDNGASLPIGEPFALAGVEGGKSNAQFLEANAASQIPGCFASLLCSCQQAFQLNLLSEEAQFCPGCGTEYTSALVVGAADDGQIWPAAMKWVFQVNGLAPEDNEDEEDEDDQDDDNGAGIPFADTK